MALFRFVVFGVVAVLLVNGQNSDGQNSDGQNSDGQNSDDNINIEKLYGDQVPAQDQVGITLIQGALDAALGQIKDLVPGGDQLVKIDNDGLKYGSKFTKSKAQADFDSLQKAVNAQKKSLEEQQNAQV